MEVQNQLRGVASQLQQLQQLIEAEFKQINFEIKKTQCFVELCE